MMVDMTELATSDAAGAVGDAAEAAQEAADRAGVRVDELSGLAELRLAIELFALVWPAEPAGGPCTLDMMRALSKAGNYVYGAFQGGDLVGASLGFFGPPGRAAMHSHVTAVAPELRGRDVGYALKLHQRAWALWHGTTRISWTFDPLVRRNAYFNLGKLAATAVEYLLDFYGPMRDVVNAGDESDRLLAEWNLLSAPVSRASRGILPAGARGRDAAIALASGEDGAPVVGPMETPLVLVGVPSEVERLRRSDPGAAREWRYALREVLGGLLAEGARITGFLREGWYVVERVENVRAGG